MVERFFTEVATLADKAALLSKEHFSVDGTLIQAWAKPQELRPEGRRQRRPTVARGRNAQAGLEGPPRAATTPTPAPPIPTRGCSGKSHNTAAIPGLPGPCADGEPLGLVVAAVVYADGQG